MFCEDCGNKLPDNSKFCDVCGARMEAPQTSPEEDAWPRQTTQQQPYAPSQQAAVPQQAYAPYSPGAPYAPPQAKRPKLWLIIAIAVAALGGLCVGAYFLFFAGKPLPEKTAGKPAAGTSTLTVEPSPLPSAVDFATTRDVSDLVGVWEGYFLYTAIGYDGMQTDGILYVGDTQLIKIKITGEPLEANRNWNEVILRIPGKGEADFRAGFEGRYLEIDGELPSYDVLISTEYDQERGGFAGTGEYIYPEKHVTFDFYMTKVDDSSWATGEFQTAFTEPQPSSSDTPTQTQSAVADRVSAKTITVNMAYDSGEGVYTGEVNGAGVPHGQGSFTMQKSDKGLAWSYEGQWENGEITGQGVRKQDPFVSTGTFRGGLLNGNGEITDDGILRYKGMWADGRLHGQGTLYTKSGTLLFEGTFENDMLVESEADRKRRGEAFMPECEDMDEMIYDGCMAEDNIFDYPVHVWGFPLGMSEQTESGTIIIGHFADDSYPICLLYRYTVGEPKITGDDWINAWGTVTGLFEYTDANGKKAICPRIEVIYWNNEQEGP